MVLLCGCSDDTQIMKDPPDPQTCVDGTLELGDPDGHPDPFGAKEASQARAGRLADATAIPPPAHGRQSIEGGDFVLVNEHIAVVIEDGGLSDGYARFGGEILAVDRVGDDGMPIGESTYVETLMGIGFSMPNPTSVTVLQDGDDGSDAIVRVVGNTEAIPFLAKSLGPLFGSPGDFQVAYDYVLAPGAEHVTIRVSVVNESEEQIDFGAIKAASDELFGFFQGSHNQLVTEEIGFGAEGQVAFAGYVGKGTSFAWRSPDGLMDFGLEQSGFFLFQGPGWLADGCAITSSDRVEVIAGGRGYDSLREAIRRSDDAEPWRAISGTLTDDAGAPIADAFVHVLDEDDVYLSRTRSDAQGQFEVHGPPGQMVFLHAQSRGYLHDPQPVAVSEDTASLAFAPHALLSVSAAWNAAPLPVRVQVIPDVDLPATPGSYGVIDERNNRLHQAFAVTGSEQLVVPPGNHRVVVSRGYEWELSDQPVTVAAGEDLPVDVVLERTVDSTGVMCADFHIHSFQSADSSDPVDYKVKGAVADGLDIPVSSEHEWVVDFGPVVEALGLEDWAFGMPSSELTTFEYGHFGVVPILPKPGELNNGAIDWIGKTPSETFAAVDALEEKPALIVNHPSGTGIGAYFRAMLLDDETGVAKSPDWSDNFDAVEVFNDSSFDENRDDSVRDWFSLLNRGLRVFAVGSSDSHSLRSSPAGYPRTCMFFGHDDPKQLSAFDVRDGVLSGDSVISGGLFMTVRGPSDAHPGATINAGSATFEITIQAPSWIEASELEVVVRGETDSTITLVNEGMMGGANLYTASVPLTLAAGDWVLFHARGVGDLAPLHPGRNPFAVSNPIFVR
jgi:Carboxypeptidase regulatory-like domain